MSRFICIYHAGCADGFTAAWAVHKSLPDDAVYIPARHGEAPPDVTGAHVFIVDFSYPRAVIEEMQRTAASILILDHHKSAEEDLRGLKRALDIIQPKRRPAHDWIRHINNAERDRADGIELARTHIVFDMDRSGAQLAWDYFHFDHTRPRLIEHVADRDLWRFEFNDTEAIVALVMSHPMDFTIWSDLAHQVDVNAWGVAQQGDAIIRSAQQDIDKIITASLRFMTIGTHRVPVVNAPHMLASKIGHILCDMHHPPFAATYFDRADGRRAFSLRSTEEGEDVADIARSFGGGGHRNAAGFTAPIGWEGDA